MSEKSTKKAAQLPPPPEASKPQRAAAGSGELRAERESVRSSAWVGEVEAALALTQKALNTLYTQRRLATWTDVAEARDRLLSALETERRHSSNESSSATAAGSGRGSQDR